MSLASKIKTPTDWANVELGALGIQDSKSDVADLVRWWQAEGGAGPQFGVPNNDDDYNPLDTTLPEPKSVSTNASGVQAYKNWQQGIDATTSTLEEPAYSQIIADLTDNAPASKFDADVTASSWGTDLSGTTADPSATPNSSNYDAGVQATVDSSNPANSPSTTKNAGPIGGFGGVLQTLDHLYNPGQSGIDWNPISILNLVPKDIETVTLEVFVRAVSSVVAIGIIFMGIKTFLNGGSGSSGGPTNVLEFVNNAQVQNAKLGQAEQRIQASAAKEEHVIARHAERLQDKERDRQSRERVAQTPRVNLNFRKSQEEKYSESHIHHYNHGSKKDYTDAEDME